MFVAVGLAFSAPTMLVAAVIPVVYVAYSALTTAPRTDGIEVRRELSTDAPSPGEAVTVTLVVENTGAGAVPDLRLADGVPERLAVTDGSPSGAMLLRAGGAARLEYTVVAKRGTHEFDPVTVRTWSLAASVTDSARVDPDGTSRFECTLAVEDAPLSERTTRFTGPLPTDTGGPGVEFHSIREYHPDDPMRRIDWRRLAKTGELTTVQYREYRAARVVILIDAREPTYVAPSDGHPTAAELATYAAARAVTAFRNAGHEVGLAALGVTDPGRSVTPAWVEPASRTEFDARAQRVYDAVAAREREHTSPTGERPDPSTPGTGTGSASKAADGGDSTARRLVSLLSPESQVLFITPILDEHPRRVVDQLLAYQHPVTVLAPDVTGEASPGQRLRRVDREVTLSRVRRADVPVVNWPWTTPLPLALRTALATSRQVDR
jgi:uncharacterized protein (DUF58 family)